MLLIIYWVIPAGYYGEHCQHEYNECLTHPCINGGECVDLIDRFHCNCGRGYTGETCSVKVNKKNSTQYNIGPTLDQNPAQIRTNGLKKMAFYK